MTEDTGDERALGRSHATQQITAGTTTQPPGTSDHTGASSDWHEHEKNNFALQATSNPRPVLNAQVSDGRMRFRNPRWEEP